MISNIQDAVNSITIGSNEIPTRSVEIDQHSLLFYPENPRIYSLLNFSSLAAPDQEEIEEKLSTMDHVNELVQSIRANGGLIDPLIVRDGDFVVLEGNSRLAAYRKLAKKDPIKWGQVKCTVLPHDIGEDLIFKLLGQYHIISRKDWSPYEQAGYMYRRNIKYKVSVEEISTEMGKSKSEIEKLIHVYNFMQEYDDRDPQRWSYYEEYLKSIHIKSLRKEYPELDAIVVEKIKTRNIAAAIDIRNKLAPIAKLKGQKRDNIIKCFIEGKNSLDECFEKADYHGVSNSALQKFKKFKEFIADPDLKNDILEMSLEQRKQCLYELKKIVSTGEKLLANLDGHKES